MLWGPQSCQGSKACRVVRLEVEAMAGDPTNRSPGLAATFAETPRVPIPRRPCDACVCSRRRPCAPGTVHVRFALTGREVPVRSTSGCSAAQQQLLSPSRRASVAIDPTQPLILVLWYGVRQTPVRHTLITLHTLHPVHAHTDDGTEGWSCRPVAIRRPQAEENAEE